MGICSSCAFSATILGMSSAFAGIGEMVRQGRCGYSLMKTRSKGASCIALAKPSRHDSTFLRFFSRTSILHSRSPSSKLISSRLLLKQWSSRSSLIFARLKSISKSEKVILSLSKSRSL